MRRFQLIWNHWQRLSLADQATANAAGPGLAPAVAVLEADDIVLAEIAPGLHLDQVQRDFARVFEPMRGADRDIGRLILRQHHLLVAAADLGGALDDYPMLGAMMVHLQ